jgi:protein-S-isoprenylcysteine O-methyltransferase Ste14
LKPMTRELRLAGQDCGKVFLCVMRFLSAHRLGDPMTDENVFRTALITILVCAAAVRGYYGVRSRRSGGKLAISENRLVMGLMGLVGLVGAYLLIGYLLFPGWVAWAALPLPSWVRWVGVALGVTAIPFLYWTHHTLGKGFSQALQVKEGQVLVTSGPYRWVRHPMYTIIVMILICLFLVSENWAIGVVFLGVAVVFVPLRVKSEEAMMVQKFGDDYRTYQRRTGSLLNPRFLLFILLSCLVVFVVLWLLSTYVLSFFGVIISFF